MSQRPWLLSASVKENILFGKPFASKRWVLTVVWCDVLVWRWILTAIWCDLFVQEVGFWLLFDVICLYKWWVFNCCLIWCTCWDYSFTCLLFSSSYAQGIHQGSWLTTPLWHLIFWWLLMHIILFLAQLFKFSTCIFPFFLLPLLSSKFPYLAKISLLHLLCLYTPYKLDLSLPYLAKMSPFHLLCWYAQ